MSERILTTWDVLQGFFSGLLLYVNDIYSCSMEPIFYLFADDTNILSSYKNLQPLVHAVSVELKKLYTWLTLNTEVKPVEKT